MTADQIKQTLGLQPHPREGGWYARTFESGELLLAKAFDDGRYTSARHTSTAIYYLLEPDTFSEMHRLASDEIFHFYAGDAVEQLQLYADGSGQLLLLGSDLPAGQRPQVAVRRGVWQGARLAPGGTHGWALLGCTVSPGFEFEDYQPGEASFLIERWPAWELNILQLCRSPQSALETMQ